MGEEADNLIDTWMRIPECKHGMIPTWCAICQKHKLPEKSTTLTFAGLLKGLK